MSKFLDLEGLGYYTQCFKPGLAEVIDEGAKNLLDCSINTLKQIFTSGTWNNNVYTIPTGDISITVNTDNTLIVSATNVTTTKIIRIGTLGTNQGNLYFSCTPNVEGAGTKFRSSIAYVGYDDGEGLNVPNQTTSRTISLEIVGSSDSPTTISNIVYKPMLCTKSKWNISTAYSPYAMTNIELTTKEQQNENDIISGFSGCQFLADTADKETAYTFSVKRRDTRARYRYGILMAGISAVGTSLYSIWCDTDNNVTIALMAGTSTRTFTGTLTFDGYDGTLSITPSSRQYGGIRIIWFD